MRHGSLFSGIGGFDLAADWMQWENVFHCEREPFAQRVLAYYWPESKLYEDVTTFDATKYRGTIDVLTGGFPCQPYSAAGKRLGKDDERHLWPQMLRIIREIAPRYIIGENVYGLVSWSDGLVFEEICLDLEAEGYEVQPYILPASAVGAPHERRRVWFIAYANHGGCTSTKTTKRKQREPKFNHGFKIRHSFSTISGKRVTSYTVGKRSQCKQTYGKLGRKRLRKLGESKKQWQTFPTESPICGANDGLPGKLDGITLSKWRKESIKGYGNAVVPQVVYQLFKTIEAYDKENT